MITPVSAVTVGLRDELGHRRVESVTQSDRCCKGVFVWGHARGSYLTGCHPHILHAGPACSAAPALPADFPVSAGLALAPFGVEPLRFADL